MITTISPVRLKMRQPDFPILQDYLSIRQVYFYRLSFGYFTDDRYGIVYLFFRFFD